VRHGNSVSPQPPFLVIREGIAFWVEDRPIGEMSVTPQAFDEGSFSDTCCYDRTGRLWRVRTATLEQSRSVLNRLMPWRQLPVEVVLDSPASVLLPQIVSRLSVVLASGNAFCEWLNQRVALDELRHRFEACASPEDLIDVARRI
jgi:hypothetical protein